jgi:maltooligosyltrehalose trehalohydrolase
MIHLHRDLIRLRREDPTLSSSPRVDGSVLGPDGFVLRYFGAAPNDDRLLVVNLGRDLSLQPAPEPLLAPPEERQWDVLWSSEDPRYGGCGTPPLETMEGWRIPGRSATLLNPGPLTMPIRGKRPLEHVTRKRNQQRYKRNG